MGFSTTTAWWMFVHYRKRIEKNRHKRELYLGSRWHFRQHRAFGVVTWNDQVKLPTYGQTQPQRGEKSEKRKTQRKNMSIEKKWRCEAKKIEHLQKAVFFTCFVELEGRKERLLKWGAEPCGGVRVQKLQAAVARNPFRNHKGKILTISEHFWTLNGSKRVCGYGAKQRSKCWMHSSFGPFLGIAIFKKCTRLWGEACFEVKVWKMLNIRASFGGVDFAAVSQKIPGVGLARIQYLWQAVTKISTKTHCSWQARYN